MNLRFSEPFFVENSRVPVWLSCLSPINIGAITLGPFVLSRGTMTRTTRVHETIHWQQYIELGILGFPLLYLVYWLIGLAKYQSAEIAYYQIPFEQEAYKHETNPYYVLTRNRWCWRKYKI